MNDSSELDISLFGEALGLRPAERSDYLDRACGGDKELRRRVEALLAAHDKAGNFLAEPATGVPIEPAPATGIIEKAGDRIGRYKLLQQIGEGGCGIVFMAEQETPVRRRVALKIVKPGMDTRSVIARFEAERQALALMDHPNIAQVFDAGATEGGRPYFVMELVRGIKITDYCDQNSLSTRARLELFIHVCSAIQHAHQKGIIHRDIKPSNILVTTAVNGKALPKVIDFGIAKATMGQRLTDKTLFTAFEMLIGTPAYMSPEQAALTSVDIDTRSDIYSLGVLLYELLTSTTPFDTSELLKAGLDEVRRVIRNEDPVRPSTRLSTMLASDLTTVSQHRGAEAPKLIRDVQGDLDWVVMKAMEKDRTRRYPTANNLALDVEHYLNGEVVLARPPSTLYKARKMVARNKLLFSSVAIIFLLLVGSLAVSVRLMMVEQNARARAQYETQVLQWECLGMSLMIQDKPAEALGNLQKALDIRRQFLGSEPPNFLVTASYIRLLKTAGKTDEADAFMAEFLKPDRLTSPGYMDVTRFYLDDLARKGRWNLGVTNATLLVAMQPGLVENYHALAPLLVVTHHVPEYRQLCQQIMARFASTQDPHIADIMAKDCLILPASGVDLNVVGKLADVAINRGHGYSSSAYAFIECCKALAEYRQDHLTEAVKWAGLAATNSFPYAKAEGTAILAMAQFKLGQSTEAHTALTNCEATVELALPKLGSDDLGMDWRDWIIVHALLSEAQGLMAGNHASSEDSISK